MCVGGVSHENSASSCLWPTVPVSPCSGLCWRKTLRIQPPINFVCVWVCVCDLYYLQGLKAFNVLAALCTIYEGKGRLKSWTLCNGLSEGVMGQGLAAPATPALLFTREIHVQL